MGVEKVRKDDTARTFENWENNKRVWINSRPLLLLLLLLLLKTSFSSIESVVFSVLKHYLTILLQYKSSLIVL